MKNHTAHKTHTGHADHVTQMKRAFFICLLATIPVFVLSDMFTSILGFAINFYGKMIVVTLFASFVFLWRVSLFFWELWRVSSFEAWNDDAYFFSNNCRLCL